jgi:Fe-S oxidoreductase
MRETERILESCDDCGACVRMCLFLKYYCDSPRELAARFKRNPLENVEIPYTCMLCGLCKRVCHLDLYPGDMCLEVRQQFFLSSQGKSLPEDFVFDHMIPRLNGIRYHQIFSSSPLFTLVRAPQNGQKQPRQIFFPGCSFPAYSPRLVLKAYDYLRRTLPGIGIVLNCCGKPSRDMGDEVRFRRMFEGTLQEFSRLGAEEIVLACINCHKMFTEHSDLKLRTIYEVFEEKGLPDPGAAEGREITIHDSCPARNRPEIRGAVRSIASRLGCEIHEMKFRNKASKCCGAGGCSPLGNTTLSDRHTEERAAQARGQLITYCAHCRERFSTKIPALHILDLVFGSPVRKSLVEYNDGWKNWLGRWYLKKRLQLIRQ